MTPNITLMVAQARQQELLRIAEDARRAGTLPSRRSAVARLLGGLPRLRLAEQPVAVVRASATH